MNSTPLSAAEDIEMYAQDIVDTVRELLRQLKRKGYDIVLALDGQSGVESARVEKPDLILMDMSLPGLDGREPTCRLRADAATRSIPVIALTAHAMFGDRAKAVEAGCDQYATKPLDLVRLLGKMEALLGRTWIPWPTAGEPVP